MNVTDLQETWQVDVGGQIYQTNFEEMAAWIYDGSLLPQDLVKRGNLRWIEARKIPSLAAIFAAREQGLPMPAVPAVAPAAAVSFGAAAPAIQAAPTDFCVIHAPTPAEYQCDVCANFYCAGCLSGGGATQCPMCGANGRRLTPPAPAFAPPAHQTTAPVFAPVAPANYAPRPSDSPPAAPPRVFPSDVAAADRKKGPGIVFSLLLSLLLAGLAAYAWAYQFAAPDEAVENALPAVVTLDEKYKAEREMEEMLKKQREAERRRAEELERSKQTISLSSGSPPQECRPGDKSINCSPAFEQFRKQQDERFEDMKKFEERAKRAQQDLQAQFAATVPDELAALEAKYKSERAKTIEKYREEKASRSFKTTFVIGFLGLMIGFVAIRKIANR